ncbi:DUF1343 domain-containing protein [Rahnella bruchi]
MRHVLLGLLLLITMVNSANAGSDIQLGVDRDNIYGPLLFNKRVGLMVNQSSLNKDRLHTIDKLLSEQEKYHFKVTTLYSVEHGIRGNADTGLGDDDHKDVKTGLPIISLYGKDADGRSRAHPTAEQLADVDIVIYDLQDVGVRFYTYTISMHHMLESLQLHHKQFMVFDRPNPLGQYVYGPILEANNISGIGIHPIPMVHGLTSGEFARMIVGEGWLTQFADIHSAAYGDSNWRFTPQDVKVIEMSGYKHDMPYSLPVWPSPNLRSDLAVQLYPSLGLFEATSLNSGRGSDYPFEQLGFPDRQFYINTCYHVDIKQKKLGWPQAGKEVCGERFNAQELTSIRPSIYNFVDWWQRFNKAGYSMVANPTQEENYLDYQDSIFLLRPTWLAKLTGTSKLPELLQQADLQGLNVDDTVKMVETHWQPGIDRYLKLREKYRFYE